MTSKTRGYQYTGIPLGRRHWNHTGWCYRPVAFQWKSCVNLYNWNILENQWSHKYTWMPLEPHWLMLASSGIPMLICIIGTHWKIIGRPLEDPTILSPVAFQCTLGFFVPGTLDCQWIATELHWLSVRGVISECLHECSEPSAWSISPYRRLLFITFEPLIRSCVLNELVIPCVNAHE